MEPKVIFVPFSDIDKEQAALGYAFALAKLYDGRVEGCHISPDPQTIVLPYAPYGALMAYPDSIIKEVENSNAENRKRAEAGFFRIVDEVKAKDASFQAVTGVAGDVVAIQGRIADLIIITRTDENVSSMDIVGDALFGSGRPLLLVPPENRAKTFDGTILIAWNGSREAARSVAFALPYLARGNVWILTESNSMSRKVSLSANDLANYLKRHGIEAKIVANPDKASSLPDSILNTAKTVNADMIVMGAWSHSRMREYVFGGVTEFMLHHADIPLFMAH
jgi:nucleotide-binding universal stress UspA family protein